MIRGWRIEIEKYPLLTEKGAWRKFNKHDRGCMERAVEEDNTDFLIPENKIRIVEGDTLYGGYYTHEDIKRNCRLCCTERNRCDSGDRYAGAFPGSYYPIP